MCGSNGSPTSGGHGGNGRANSITGSSVTRAGGGGGGYYTPDGTGAHYGDGGTGGGGDGSQETAAEMVQQTHEAVAVEVQIQTFNT